LIKKWDYIAGFIKAKFFLRKLPLLVSWHLTYRCNYDCVYCGISGKVAPEELGTGEVLSLIDELYLLGTKMINFCGGECLLRNDFSEILDYCKRKRIDTGLISNGALVPKYIDSLKKLSLLKLSFDGPENIHDRLRGNGSYVKLMNAVNVALKEGINVTFNCTLTRLNLDSVDFILEQSRRLGVFVKFSPVNYIHSVDKNIEQLIPNQAAYRNVVEKISKEAGRCGNILNSSASLGYIKLYPQGKVIRNCAAGHIFCHLKPDGSVHLCERILANDSYRYRKGTFKKAFLTLRSLRECSQCWCTGTLDLNFIYQLKISALLNTLRLV